MKRDIERLMEKRGLDAVVILGPSAGNPNMFYAVNGAGMTRAVYLQRLGDEPHLVHSPMERDQARATGIDTSTFAQNDYARIDSETGGNVVETQARFLDHLFRKQSVRGRVGVYGCGEMSQLYPVLRRVADIDGVELFEEPNGMSLFEEARLTKDEIEVDRIRKVSESCFAAYDRMKDIIRGGRLVDGKLQATDGSPLKIGHLRRATRATFAEFGVVEDHASIIAQGLDGTAPHNCGTDSDVLREGASIIVDIFPCEPDGGYFFDITRTLCVGPAPERLREVYSQVKEVLTLALAELKAGERGYSYQEKACERFEAMGYGTIRQNAGIESGYVHGLGHGLGLDLHEAPRLGGAETNTDTLEPGMVFTVEPGLYLPEEEIAVRLEDVVYVHAEGRMENLSNYPYDLEVFPTG